MEGAAGGLHKREGPRQTFFGCWGVEARKIRVPLARAWKQSFLGDLSYAVGAGREDSGY